MDAAELSAQAMRMLAVREHSTRELRRKLRQRRGEEAVVEAVLERLTADGMLSDGRFVEAYVRSRIERGQGPIKIRAGLVERGVSGGLVEEALDFESGFWNARAQAVQARRFGNEPPADGSEWARRARFLWARGFPSDVVYRTLGEQPV